MLSDDPTWGGLGSALLVLGALWWAWVGYAWLTNAVNPDEGAVRLAIFGAMARAAPRRAGGAGCLRRRRDPLRGRLFSVRLLHIALFTLASREETARCCGSVHRLAVGIDDRPGAHHRAGFTDGAAQAGLWTSR